MCDFLLVNPCNLMPNAYLFHTLVEKLEFLIHYLYSTLPFSGTPSTFWPVFIHARKLE